MSAEGQPLSIRASVVLLVLAVLLPMGGMVAWFLAAELQHARDDGYAKVKILATSAAADVDRFLQQSHATLGRLAERPLVKALDPGRCDPIIAEYLRLHPEYVALGVRDLHSRSVCASVADPIPQLDAQEFPWFEAALGHGEFSASDAMVRRRSGRWITVLSHSIHDQAGAVVGVLDMPVDLLNLSRQLLGPTPKGAVVTVVDRQRAVLLRSAEAATFVGRRVAPNGADPLRGRREGFLTATDRDGVARLFAVVTLPDVEWRVAAGLPEAEVFAEYESTLRRTAAIGLALLLLALALAWRLGAAIAGPITGLARAAAAVAAGDNKARAQVDGAAEVAAVALEFNRMLDARDRSDTALSESEQRYRALVNWTTEAVAVHLDGKMLYVNPAAVRMLGAKSAQELVGRSGLDFVHPEFRQAVFERFRQAADDGLAAPLLEAKFIRCDGSVIDVEVQGLPIVYDGQAAVLASMHDVTEFKQAQAELAHSHAELQRLLAAQDKIQEEERKRMARELHDDLQQTLAAIRIDLGAIGERLGADASSVASLIDEVDGLAAAAIASTRRIVNDLRPQMLEDLGLVPALEVLAGQFSLRSGIECRVQATGPASDELMASPAVATALFRVVQEALNNVIKHAQASRVQIDLARAADGTIVLRVSDDGRGIPSGQARRPDEFGLLGMRERVRAFGGVLRIDSQPGTGTTVEVTVPNPPSVPVPPDPLGHDSAAR